MYHVSFPGLGIENLEIHRTVFSIGNFELYWYGVLITVAVLITMFLAARQAPRFGIRSESIFDYFLAMIPAMIIFARLYYIVFSWEEFRGQWTRIFDTRSGGLAFYGGVIGGALAFYIVSRIKKIPFNRALDFLVVYVPLGQAIGRWGNFFNQEAFGTNTDLPWGMISEGTRTYLARLGDPALNPNQPVHPTFLYEFIGNMIIFGILLYVRKRRSYPYQVVAAYLGLYGLLRFFVEGVRTDSLYIGTTDIRVSQLLSALMVLAAVAYALIQRTRQRRLKVAHEEALLRGESAPLPKLTAWTDGPVTETDADVLPDPSAVDPDTPDTEIPDRDT